jgi:hypothetical protein
VLPDGVLHTATLVGWLEGNMDCGGKRNATPLSEPLARAKACAAFAPFAWRYTPTHFMPKRSQSGSVAKLASEVPSTTRSAVAGSPP